MLAARPPHLTPFRSLVQPKDEVSANHGWMLDTSGHGTPRTKLVSIPLEVQKFPQHTLRVFAQLEAYAISGQTTGTRTTGTEIQTAAPMCTWSFDGSR